MRILGALAGLMVVLSAGPVLAQASLDAPPAAGFEGQAECPFNGYQQPFDPENFGTARTSDVEAGFRVFEDMVDPYCIADRVRAWGIEIDFASPTFLCSEDDLANFNVALWGQSGGSPDTFNQILGLNDLPGVEDDTGVPFGGFGNVVRYDIDFGSSFATDGAVWTSIERTNDADSCFWLWVDESATGTYDDLAYQESAGGFVTSDQAFCLISQCADCCGDVDPPVPATTGAGLVVMTLSILGGGVYFAGRRRTRS